MPEARKTGARPAVSAALAAIAAFLAFAALAIGSAADRVSGSRPSASALVPGALAASSKRVAAGGALAAGDQERAEPLASSAVRAAPANAEALALLGSSALTSGDDTAALAAFTLGAAAGWSEPVTQAYWFEQAMAEGNAQRAALHLDALLRVLPAQRSVQLGIDRVLGLRGGGEALLARLDERPRWRSALVGGTQDLSSAALRRRAALVERAIAAGAISCDEAAGFGGALEAKGISFEACPAT